MPIHKCLRGRAKRERVITSEPEIDLLQIFPSAVKDEHVAVEMGDFDARGECTIDLGA